MQTDYQYFMARIKKTDSCWLWIGDISAKGYGRFSRNKNRSKAHRWSYEHFIGPIPEGLTIDHLCMVKCCVNPEHLEAVTAEENTRRYLATRSDLYDWSNGKCRKGHELAIVGYRERPKKGRECMGCRKEQGRKYYLKKISCDTPSVA